VGLWINVCFSEGDACAFLCLLLGVGRVDPLMMFGILGKGGGRKKKGNQNSFNFLPANVIFPSCNLRIYCRGAGKLDCWFPGLYCLVSTLGKADR